MQKKIKFLDKINVRIMAMLLILFAIAAITLSVVIRNSIRRLHEENFTERVLLTNALMASVVDSEDIAFFVDLIKGQDDEFKRRQLQFYHDRETFWQLSEKGAAKEELTEVFCRLEAFYEDMAVFKTEKYWEIVKELQHLKEVSKSTYLYVMADTGLKNDDGEPLYTFIFDAEDTGKFGENADTDGLGTCDIGEDSITKVYKTKKQMEWVSHYYGGYGELYYAYAPIFNADGEVVAVFGTDLELEKMNGSISDSSMLFNAIFLAFFVIIIGGIYVFLHRIIAKPLSSLTNTAHELAKGNVYAPISETAIKQRGEIGMLANAVNDMSFAYQEMISSTGKLFGAANIGKLDVRNDVANFKGDIQKVMKQINDTLDAVILYLNSIPESIFIMSGDYEINFKNEQYVRCFGDMTALEFFSNAFPEDENPETNPANRAKYLKERFAAKLKQETNNTVIWVNRLCLSIITKEIDLADGPEKSVLVIAVDITDLMNEKNNAQAAAKAKTDFLSRMSHEMRTPMNAIIGMTSIGKNMPEIEKKDYAFQKIEAASTHLLGLINDVLDMSKIEAGKFDLENVPMNIEKTLMKICNIVIDDMEKKNQKFNVALSKDLNLNYIADDLRLSQVITNLLSNAMKFTPEGGKITLSVEKISQEEKTNTLRFAVADTGIGMADEQIARLFNAFEQADGGVSRKFGGTGLGLAISKNIVEKMGGRIWAKSEPGTGSSFIFEVKLERAPRQDTVIFDGIRPEDIRLLIVENDEDVGKRFLGITESFGIKADFAATVGETFALVESAGKTNRAYDIIFLDYDMPDIDGMDFANQLKCKIDKNTIIITTTHIQWNRIEKSAMENNFTRYITKPIFPSSVLDAINDVVGTTLKSLNIKTDEADEAPDLSGVSIILAEDVEINREIFLAVLESTNISVECAENGLAAVEKFKENPDKYDLIVMDLQMPEMDGYQATQTIRALDIPKAKTIPIIAMTANAFKEDIERCLASGMDDHLPKPIDEKIVIEKIAFYSKRQTGR
ncbi:MAG: response regulator [Oscillospiraceae bacterium]|nr:response regulator [Oscillospiraceae bacterium]